MEMPGLKKLAEDKRQAVHQRLSQCQLGRDGESVRKNASRGGNKVTPRETVWSPCLRRGFLFAYGLAPRWQREMGWAPEAG